MKVTRFTDAQPYDAPLHFDVKSLRLQDLATTGATSGAVGLSYYLPGGRAEMSSGPTEKIYVLIEGELEVTLGSGEVVTLAQFDSCRIAPNETRAVLNATNRIATLLVFMAAAS